MYYTIPFLKKQALFEKKLKKIKLLSFFQAPRLNLLVYTLIFIVVSVIGTRLSASVQKADHFILVQIDCAYVGIVFLIVIVKDTGFTGGSVYAHDRTPFSLASCCQIYYIRKSIKSKESLQKIEFLSIYLQKGVYKKRFL